MTLEFSDDLGQSWFPLSGGGSTQVKITHTSSAGSSSFFDTEIDALSIDLGTFMLRESPTKQSLGKHTIAPDPRGYRISSFFDVFLELSLDGGSTWIPADRSMRVQVSAPPAAPNSIFATHTGNDVILNWLGSFQLQSAHTVTGPYNDVPGITTGPFTLTPAATESQMYFRLRQ
jgi:hypothetical protein